MPTITKSQIRPRRRRVRFSNAEILSFDTVGFYMLVDAVPVGFGLTLTEIQFLSNITVAYGNVDTAPFLLLFDDFMASAEIEDIATSNIMNFSRLFATAGPALLLYSFPAQQMRIDDSGTEFRVEPSLGASWNDFANIASAGGIGLIVSNGGADLNGGDPANYLDLFITYEIVNLIEG